MIRVAVAGAGGRMGQALIEAVLADPKLALAAALDVAKSPLAGAGCGAARAAVRPASSSVPTSTRRCARPTC